MSSGVRRVGAPGPKAGGGVRERVRPPGEDTVGEAAAEDTPEVTLVGDADVAAGEGAPRGEGAPPGERSKRREPADDRASRAPSDHRRPAVTANAAPASARRQRRRRRLLVALVVVAVLGVAGTIGFGLAWGNLQSQQNGEAQARAAANTFLVALTNFDAKSVDADFSSITNMAAGQFATQAKSFFNSAIRQELENALASSRGQVRALYVQSYGGGQATVYAVVDQLYANNKISSPQSDVLRVVVDLADRPSGWKVDDVTVLEGPSLGSSSSSSSGSSSSGSSSSG